MYDFLYIYRAIFGPNKDKVMLESRTKNIVVCQGELSVSADPDVMLSAVLGSCIATCLWDPNAHIGGMNHILLPGDSKEETESNKFGVYAMEALINEMMKFGARKSNLVAKLFGGAMIIDNEQRIGEANVRFARDFLDLESIPIQAESVGGTRARRVRFYPVTGKARQMLTAVPSDIDKLPVQTNKQNSATKAISQKVSGRVEIF